MGRQWWLHLFGNTQARGERGGKRGGRNLKSRKKMARRLVEFLQGVIQAGEKGIFRIC